MFTLSIVTPNKKLITDLEIEEVIVPAFRGELNILPGHAPLITTLSTGVLRYRASGSSKWQIVAMSWGYLEANPSTVNVLAETAETPEELDAERIRIALADATQKLNSGELEWESIEKYQRKYARAVTRQEVLQMGNGGAAGVTGH